MRRDGRRGLWPAITEGRFRAPWLALALGIIWARPALSEESPPTLTLEQAVETAFRLNPRLRGQRARISEARGRLVDAETYPFNPELEVQAAGRIGQEDTSGDYEIGLAQEFELAGQRDKRATTARAEIQVAQSERQRALRLLAAEVHLAFVDALEAREILAVARAEAELAHQLFDFARRSLDAGSGTQLDVNIASADVGRAEQAVGVSIGEYAAARAALAEALGLSEAALPVPEGSLTPSEAALPTLAALVSAAETNRADLRALRDVEQAANARIELARAEALPNLRVGVFAGREAGVDTMVGVGIAMPLPVFARNRGAIAEAESAAIRAAADRDSGRLSVVREVVTAYERHRAGIASAASLRERVVGTTEANLELLGKAFEAGKIGWTDVLVMRRTLFDAQRAVVETNARIRRARVRIDIATGKMPLPAGAETE